MSQHRLLNAANARLGTSTAAIASAQQPAPAAAAPPIASEGEPIDVVSVADAHAAIADAEARGRVAGADAANARFSAVLGSEAGQANVPLAVFMLESNPTASADAIIAHLDKQPKMEAAPAPAPVAAITTALELTPKVEVAPNANNGNQAADPQSADKLWDTAMSSVATSGFGAELAPGIPRTGN